MNRYNIPGEDAVTDVVWIVPEFDLPLLVPWWRVIGRLRKWRLRRRTGFAKKIAWLDDELLK